MEIWSRPHPIMVNHYSMQWISYPILSKVGSLVVVISVTVFAIPCFKIWVSAKPLHSFLILTISFLLWFSFLKIRFHYWIHVSVPSLFQLGLFKELWWLSVKLLVSNNKYIWQSASYLDWTCVVLKNWNGEVLRIYDARDDHAFIRL